MKNKILRTDGFVFALFALATSVLNGGCGEANADDCKDSVLAMTAGECETKPRDGTGGTGGTGGLVGTGAAGGASGANGGTGARGGTPPTGGAGGIPPTPVVYEWGKKDKEGSLDSGEWRVDNAVGVHEGAFAVHPPNLPAGETKSMTFDCGGEDHTQISFSTRRLTGNTELELFDGITSRGTITAYDGWTTQVVNVPPGKHTYTFTARNIGTTDIEVPFVLDSFVCKSATPEPGLNGFVDSDDAFVPVEVGGEWFVDNLRSIHQGEAALHPPSLRPGDERSMTFECGADQTQLSFATRRLSGNTELELFDGAISRGTITAYDGWTTQVVDVPLGNHTFTLTARNLGTTTIDVPFVLDTFVCRKVTPKAAVNGFVAFDDGFMPIEVEGDWLVDNLRSVHQGEAALHPPVLEPGEERWMTVACTGSELSFSVRRLSGNTELELDDGIAPQKITAYDGWTTQMTQLMSAQKITLTARNLGTTQIDVPYVVDTFVCTP